MRVYAVSKVPDTSCAVQKSPAQRYEIKQQADSFKKTIPDIPQINFGAYKIHIVDGGAHAQVMEHFARAIVKSVDDVVDVILHKADTNPRYSGMKQMKSIEEKLTFLNEGNGAQPGDFVAVPCSAQVQLNLLADMMGLKPKSIEPSDVKSRKNDILKFLQDIPDWKRNAMDPNQQGIQHVFGVIQQINALVKKGVNVYLPAGHPIEQPLKAYAAERERGKEDLYKYIYTRGKECGFRITLFKEALQKENIYRFNLLALSDAHVVNVKDITGRKDYVFAAYDSCVNDGARGVFNFYPVRNKEGEILGYSFTDKRTVQYPKEEYLANDEFANIARFVGKNIRDCWASGTHTHMMANLIKWREPHTSLPDRLYRVSQIYSIPRLRKEKILEKGSWVDKSENLFFELNDNEEVVFRKCDCEGSGRPSVLPMWGSCFATINAIKRDIVQAVRNNRKPFSFSDWSTLNHDYFEIEKIRWRASSKYIEFRLNQFIKKIKPYEDLPDTFKFNVMAHDFLYEMLQKQGKRHAAEGVANKAINLRCKELLHSFKTSDNVHGFYDVTFAHYWDLPKDEVEKFQEKINKIAEYFSDVAQFCSSKGNDRAAQVSSWAANMMRISDNSVREAIVSRRASGSISMGDLFDEYNRH